MAADRLPDHDQDEQHATDDFTLEFCGGTLAEAEVIQDQLVFSVGYFDIHHYGALVWHWCCTN